MKKCPQCNRAYADDELRFCLADGSALTTAYDPDATQRIPSSLATSPITAVSDRDLIESKSRKSVRPLFIYILIALLALIVGGAIVLLMRTPTREVVHTATPVPDAVPANRPPAPQANTSVPAQSPANANTNQSNASSDPTTDGIDSLLTRWKAAQNSGDRDAYASCYAPEFQGIVRTSAGEINTYDYYQWMAYRARLISQPGGANIEIKNLRVRISNQVATVEFDQYYRSSTYSDWGPKIMRVRKFSDGEKIVYEELKSSRPL